jgi:hypothetical protein
MSLAIRLRPPPRVVTTGGSRPAAAGTSSEAPLAPASVPPRPPALGESQLERLIKLVPADVVALYIPAIGLGTLTTWPYYALAVTIGATVLVPTLLYLDARSSGDRVQAVQYIVRTLAFVAWAFVISQPLAPYHLNPVVPALIALVLPVLGERLLD